MNTKNVFFSFLAAGYCPKNLAFARKIMVVSESGGGVRPAPRPPGSYAYGQTRGLWLTVRCIDEFLLAHVTSSGTVNVNHLYGVTGNDSLKCVVEESDT